MFDLNDALEERFSGIDGMVDSNHRGTMLNQNDIE
jgi:hypothetical protein